MRILGLAALGCLLLLATVWAAAMLCFDVRLPWLRLPLAAVYALSVLAFWIFIKRRWLAVSLTAGGFALVLAWWFTLKPSNERDWQPDVAVLPYADINGKLVTLHNIRNCDYRTETDFDVQHYDKTFDLDALRTVDLYMVYWGSPHMAHTMVSFGFDGGDYLCFSIETRKEKGESLSLIHIYELIPGVLVFRPESGLLYFNMDHVRDTIAERVRVEATPPKLVVLDLSAAPFVDMHSAHMLAELAGDLTAAGIRFQAVEARSSVRDRLRSEGLEEKLGGINRFASVADVVEVFQRPA